MPTQPQDHKPAQGEPFTFTDSKGKKHKLPLASEARSKLSGGDLMDATLGGEIGQIAYLFKVLKAAEPDPKAMEALRAMSQEDMMEVLSNWGDHGDGDGASLGE